MKRRKSLALIIATLLLVTIFAGCSNKKEEAKAENETRVVNSLKGDVKIPANPKRIADISGASEDLIILGHTPVATANGDAYHTKEFPSYLQDKMGKAKIVGYNMSDTMDVEAILNTNPDLIIMSERQEKIYDQLKEIAPVVVMKDYGNDWKARMLDVAKLFGQEDDAKKWLSDYDNKAQAAGKEIAEKNGDQTYLSLLASGGQFYVLADAGIGGVLYNDMKLAKPAKLPKQEGISLPVVTIEGLSEIDADHIIVIATDADKKELENNSVWQSMRAVKEGNATILNSTPYFTQGYQPIGKELLLNDITKELTKK
ncbi:ferrichrome ABC transporter substrate-binding protein [Bacillus pseudomycoides]|nr:ferrichrome ABC transporter substrate-binding protein [Bacillus pseudomycoides]